jgi:hypothetical protein
MSKSLTELQGTVITGYALDVLMQLKTLLMLGVSRANLANSDYSVY